MVIIVVPSFNLQIVQFALRQQIRGSQLNVRSVLQIRSINDLDRFEIFHVFYRNRKENGARVASHRSYADHSPLRSHAFNRLRVDLSLRVQDLYVRHFDWFLGLGLHNQLGFRCACTSWNPNRGLLEFRLHSHLGRLWETPFSVAFT